VEVPLALAHRAVVGRVEIAGEAPGVGDGRDEVGLEDAGKMVVAIASGEVQAGRQYLHWRYESRIVAATGAGVNDGIGAIASGLDFALRIPAIIAYDVPMTHAQRFSALRLLLSPAPRPVAVYRPVVAGKLAYVSGHGPLREDGTLITGRVGAELDLGEGYAAARQVGLALLATLRSEFGDLDAVARVVKVLGMVNSAPDFYDHPKVINGCSELFAQVFGDEAGVGARSAVGMRPPPGNIAVEIEAIFEMV